MVGDMQLYFNDQSLLYLCTSLVTTPTKTTPYIVYYFTYIVKIAAPFKIEQNYKKISLSAHSKEHLSK